MRHRFNMLDRDVRDGLRQITGKNDMLSQARRFAFHGISFMDAVVTAPSWKAAYMQALDEGHTHEHAVDFADKVIRLTQGSGGAKDLAAVQRQNEMMKMFTMFYSYFSVLYSRQRDMIHQYNGLGDLPKTLARSFFVIAAPAILGELLAGRGPDDDEDTAAWIARNVVVYPFQAIPAIRDIASSVESGYGYQPTPLASAGKSLVSLLSSVAKYADEDSSTELSDVAGNALDASGYIFGLPTAQAKITGGYLWDVSEGNESPDDALEFMRNLMFRRKKQ